MSIISKETTVDQLEFVSERKERQANWLARSESLAKHFSYCAQDVPWGKRLKIAIDIVDGNTTYEEGIDRLTFDNE